MGIRRRRRKSLSKGCFLSLVLRRCLRSSPTSREPPMERWGLKSSSTYRSSAKRLSMQLTGDSFMDSTISVIWYILWIDQLFDNVEMFSERAVEKQERALTQCQIILQEQGWFPDNGWNQACEQECNKEWDQGETLSKIKIHFNENLFTGDNPRVWLWQGWKTKHSRVPPGCLFSSSRNTNIISFQHFFFYDSWHQVMEQVGMRSMVGG